MSRGKKKKKHFHINYPIKKELWEEVDSIKTVADDYILNSN